MAADASAASNRVQPPRLPRIGRTKDLLTGPHGPGSPLFHALVLNSPDYDYYFEDFNWATITASAGPALAGASNLMAYAESNAGATDVAKLTPTEADPSAAVLVTTANTYNQTLKFCGAKRFSANCYAWTEIRMKVDQVTDPQITFGFADAIPGSAAAVVSDIDTPAVTTVADGAFYSLDLSQTLKTAALVSIGTSTAVSKTTFAATGAPFGIPTAATYFTIRIYLEGNGQTSGKSTAYCFVNDALVATQVALGPDSEKLMFPFLLVGSTAGTSLTTTIDYIRAGQQKAGSPF